MSLFAILHHLVAPIADLTGRNEERRRKAMLERSLSRIPQHLRDDVIRTETFWRYD